VFGPDGRPRATLLFCGWLAWSRFRVVLPTWDRKLGTLLACLDTTLRKVGGAPAFVLTDNEKTVTVEHVAGVPVRHPMIVAAGRHYGLTVHTCVPFDPESKGGSEATVRIAKADLVPTKANLRTGYNSFAELIEACEEFCVKVNTRLHRETHRIPAEVWRSSRAGCIRCTPDGMLSDVETRPIPSRSLSTSTFSSIRGVKSCASCCQSSSA
jgi:transposase